MLRLLFLFVVCFALQGCAYYFGNRRIVKTPKDTKYISKEENPILQKL